MSIYLMFYYHLMQRRIKTFMRPPWRKAVEIVLAMHAAANEGKQ
jgi:hypothetical protein